MGNRPGGGRGRKFRGWDFREGDPGGESASIFGESRGGLAEALGEGFDHRSVRRFDFHLGGKK